MAETKKTEKTFLTVEDMMSLDRGKLEEKPTRDVRAKHLSELFGRDVYVKMEALSGNRYTRIMMEADDHPEKLYDTQAKLVSSSIIEPNLSDPKLMKYFGVASPFDVVKLCFPGGEMPAMATIVAKLSGYITEDGESINLDEEIKN